VDYKHSEIGTSRELLDASSLFWRLGYPRTNMLLTGRALLMQVSHPVIGEAIIEHSKYTTDPWGRLRRSRESTLLRVFGGPLGIEEGRRLLELHSHVVGVDDRRPYNALDEEPWKWTFSATFDSILYYYRHFSRRLPRHEEERLYAEWRRVGCSIGIRLSAMPYSLSEFERYVDDMTISHLARSTATDTLLKMFTFESVGCPAPWLPQPIWRGGRFFARRLVWLGAIGSLPPILRERLGVFWTHSDERALERLRTLVRSIDSHIPKSVLHDKIAYEALKKSQQARAASTD
jgi:uncharacterized protein (DUF2236 family)